MPSASLQHWLNDRMPRLNEIDSQCSTSRALIPPNPPPTTRESSRLYRPAQRHFQGFCRDLYTESSQIIVSESRAFRS